MYIGGTNDFIRRMVEHKCHSKKYSRSEHNAHTVLFYEDVRKFGWDNFDKRVILECKTFEQREELEKKIIAEYKEKYGEDMLYNYCKGGLGGQTHDVSGKNNPMYGKHKTEEEKRNLSEKLKGRKDSDETRKKKSLASKGKKKNPESYAKKCKPITIININTNEIRTYPSRSEMERNGINPITILKGSTTRKGWKLLEEGQETTESIDNEKDVIE